MPFGDGVELRSGDMYVPRRVVLLGGPEDDRANDPTMKFRLTYEGEVRPTGGEPLGEQKNPLAEHKHRIRRHFHHQLKQLWESNRFLREKRVHPKHHEREESPSSYAKWAASPDQELPLKEYVAGLYHEFGYRFVPLVRESWSLLCSVEILFLRRDAPSDLSVITAGDIDNRVKTVIDTLRRPRNQTELVGDDRSPRQDEDPFFVLLEDDKQVSRLIVEADALLVPPQNTNADASRAQLVITVEIRPYYVTSFNLSFA
jgi:hypothetical protein